LKKADAYCALMSELSQFGCYRHDESFSTGTMVLVKISAGESFFEAGEDRLFTAKYGSRRGIP
jgi:hypothetical protein